MTQEECATLRAHLRVVVVVVVVMIPPTIRVPISYGDGTHVAIDSRSLPTRAEDVLGVLQSELAPLSVWMECAKAYLADENEEAFLEIVGSGCSPGKSDDRSTISLTFALRAALLFSLSRSFCIAFWERARHAPKTFVFETRSDSLDTEKIVLE